MKNFILGILIIASANLFSQNAECIDFKNGKFQIVDQKVGNSIIERNGSKQIEFGTSSKLKMEFNVKWLNDCIYTLELEKVLENPNNIQIPKGMILTVEIIKTMEKSYIQKSSSNINDMVMEFELFKIE